MLLSNIGKNIHNPAYMLSHIHSLQKTGLLSNLFIQHREERELQNGWRKGFFPKGERPVLRLCLAAIEMSAYALENRNVVSDVKAVSITKANQTSNIDFEKPLTHKQTTVVSINSRC